MTSSATLCRAPYSSRPSSWLTMTRSAQRACSITVAGTVEPVASASRHSAGKRSRRRSRSRTRTGWPTPPPQSGGAEHVHDVCRDRHFCCDIHLRRRNYIEPGQMRIKLACDAERTFDERIGACGTGEIDKDCTVSHWPLFPGRMKAKNRVQNGPNRRLDLCQWAGLIRRRTILNALDASQGGSIGRTIASRNESRSDPEICRSGTALHQLPQRTAFP